ncbi:hypothetical protein ABZP36_033878 [Zizania latifolia]
MITGDDVAGTFGYLAPEYFMHGKVSDKIDVYSFGVVLLELISGRKPVCSGGSKDQESLVMWANSVIQGGKLTDLVDPSLPTDGCDVAGEVERMTLTAALCIRLSSQRRPIIANVLKLLNSNGDAVKWARSQTGLSIDDGDDGAITSPEKDIQSYIILALLDVDDDATYVSDQRQLHRDEHVVGGVHGVEEQSVIAPKSTRMRMTRLHHDHLTNQTYSQQQETWVDEIPREDQP